MIQIEAFEFRKFVARSTDEMMELTYNYVEKLEGDEGLIEFIVLFGENKDLVVKSSAELGIKFEDLGIGYGIVSIKAKDYKKITKLKGVQYIEFPKVFTITDIESNIASCVPQVWNNYGLKGNGVLIGFIDTGIDYTHPAFVDINGNTRIKYIYDLYNEKIYDEAIINLALKNPDPLSILDLKDSAGHGTTVASVAAGGGDVNKDYYGVAPEASIIMVKITGDGVFKSTLSTQLMRGLKFLIDKSNELEMPLVVNVSLSTNDGAHNGTSLIEKYIDSYCQFNRVAVVIAAGNEGAAGHHFSTKLKGREDVFFNIAENEKKITLQIYNSTLTKLEVEIVTPSGDSTSTIFMSEGINKLNVGGHGVFIYNSGPKPFDKVGEISITISVNNGTIETGQWVLRVNNITKYEGIMDIWLPITARLNPKTKFLQPDPFNTLGIPATVPSVISVGSYSSSALNYSYFSGRGVERAGSIIKPDILAPGENILGAISKLRFGAETGTSVAAPQVAGVCALMIEWGIVKNNDPYLFGERLKYYILAGATRDKKGSIYPSKTYGYGYLCAGKTIELLLNNKKDHENRNIDSINNLGENHMRTDVDKDKKEKKNKKLDDTTKKDTNIKKHKNEKKKIKENPYNKKSDKKDHKNCKEIKSTTKQYYLNDGFIDFLVQYEGNIIEDVEKYNDFASAITIDESFAIISTRVDKTDFISKLPGIIYIDSGGVYTLEKITPTEASKALSFQYNPYLNLTGRGTIIGIIDTGIDYLNDEFIREDGTSNIIRIWDQSQSEINEGASVIFGSEYTRKDINEALKLKAQGKDPYTIVKTKDNNGHGTAIAGLIAGRGSKTLNRGIAIDADIAMVKLKPASERFKRYYATNNYTEYQYRNTDILLAIRYLFRMAKELDKPMVIYIPLGTTVGGHDGTSVIERYITDLSDSSGILFVTSTGNQGNGENHTSGKISSVGEKKKIELEVGENQTSIFMTIYGHAPDKFGFSVSSPSGDLFEDINPKQKNGVNLRFVYEGTDMNILFIEPSELTGDQVIVVTAQNLKPGIWTFTLIGEYIVHGKYDAWLVQRELLDENTKFLTPTPDTTITIPASAHNIITIGSYNQNNNALVSSSGRGKTRDGRQCPLIAAGGVGALLGAPNNSKKLISGGSVAGGVVAGCCLQLLQWGIVDGNDKTMYATKIKTYLMRGTNKREKEKYPNDQVGYGFIDMKVLFNNLSGSALGTPKSWSEANFGAELFTRGEQKEEFESNEEFFYRGLYIRKSKD